MFVEIGVDRVHHAFWKYMDQAHHLYEPGNPSRTPSSTTTSILDEKIGRLIAKAGEDTVVLVVSDHGAKRMKGAFCVNEWLIDKGWLAVKERPSKPTSIDDLAVDWAKTKAWAWGGYYARVFLNVEGREPKGVIPARGLREGPGRAPGRAQGHPRAEGGGLGDQGHQAPGVLSRSSRASTPTSWSISTTSTGGRPGRSATGRCTCPENDTGPDDAVHAQQGIYILYDPKGGRTGRRDVDILDIAPTVLDLMGLAVPPRNEGPGPSARERKDNGTDMCEDHEGFTLWFTGLPCSGKSAVGDRVAAILKEKGHRVERLDGDIVRQDLTRDLGFSKKDRDENIRRVTFVAKLLSRNGVAVLTSFISPYREMRDRARKETTNFVEVYAKCPLEVCIQRDVKGMYQKAIRGEIKEFTGVSDPYEEPVAAEIVLETDKETMDESVQKVLRAYELGLSNNRTSFLVTMKIKSTF